ncbi:MAG: flagellar basal body P-ring formation protein FlgA [bacterium]|jgi:flagella basal body P-ring formation protein FlgA
MKDKWIYLFSLLSLLLTLSVAANSDVEKGLISFVQEKYRLDTARTQVEIDRLAIPVTLGDYDSLQITALSTAPPRGTLPLQIEFIRGGAPVARCQARLKISHFDTVLTAVCRIKRGEALSPGQFTLQRQNVTSLTEKPLTSFASLENKTALRNINIGQPLLENMLEDIPDIKPGQEIQIKYNSGALSVSVIGVALSKGHIGETIKVRNKQTGKIIKAVVIDSASVALAQL